MKTRTSSQCKIVSGCDRKKTNAAEFAQNSAAGL